MPRASRRIRDPLARSALQLATLRGERKETQKQLASRLGMTESMISRLESHTHVHGHAEHGQEPNEESR